MKSRLLSSPTGWYLIALWLVASCVPVTLSTPTAQVDSFPVSTQSSMPATVSAVADTPPSTNPTTSTPATAIVATPFEPQLQLTFVSDRHPGFDGVYAVSIGCLQAEQPCIGDPQLLFEVQSRLDALAWSADGDRIAFLGAGVDSSHDIFVAEANGEDPVNITNSPGSESSIAWSPDGSKIAYVYESSTEPGQIRIYDFSTSTVVTLLEDAFNPNAIGWVPAGDMMAYSAQISHTDGRTQISIVDKNGVVLNQIPQSAESFTRIHDFTFSADGQRLAFTGDVTSPSSGIKVDIYVTDTSGDQVINLTEHVGDNLDPAWLPLADWIAFDSNRTGDAEVYLIKPDGTHLTNLTENPGRYDGNPAWRLIRTP